MTPKRRKQIATTHWAPLVDARRIRTQRVLALLDRLARESAMHLFGDGARPQLSAAETRTLRPLLGRPAWNSRGRRAAIRRLLDRLRLSQLPSELYDNNVAVLVAKSTRPGWFDWVWAAGAARRSPLLGGAELLRIFEDNAWSRPDLSMAILEVVRTNWRGRTLFSPEEPEWPVEISTAVLRVLVATAVARPQRSFWTWLAGGGRRRVLEGLDASLDSAVERIAGRSLIEQAIVVDAVARHRNRMAPAVVRAVAKLPLAQLDAYAGRFVHTAALLNPEGTNAGPSSEVNGGATDFPAYVIRLAEGRL